MTAFRVFLAFTGGAFAGTLAVRDDRVGVLLPGNSLVSILENVLRAGWRFGGVDYGYRES